MIACDRDSLAISELLASTEAVVALYQRGDTRRGHGHQTYYKCSGTWEVSITI